MSPIIPRWEPQGGGFTWDPPDFGRVYVRRLVKGSRYWTALHNGQSISRTHFKSAADARAVAVAYVRQFVPGIAVIGVKP